MGGGWVRTLRPRNGAMLKWVSFFLVAFAGIFVGLLFATGVAQKQLLPMLRHRLAHAAPAARRGAAAGGADSSGGRGGSPAPAEAPSAGAAAPSDSAAAVATTATRQARTAPVDSTTAQRLAALRAVPVP